jgi:hypothetical protein
MGLDKDEKESLSDFLHTSLKVDVTTDDNSLTINSETLPPEELKKTVNKYVYRRNLNHAYWVSLDGEVVKINEFKGPKKPEKRKKQATPPSTIKHGW